jgi:hypothetical protein
LTTVAMTRMNSPRSRQWSRFGELMLAGDRFRHAVAEHVEIGLTETVAMSHLSMAAARATLPTPGSWSGCSCSASKYSDATVSALT